MRLFVISRIIPSIFAAPPWALQLGKQASLADYYTAIFAPTVYSRFQSRRFLVGYEDSQESQNLRIIAKANMNQGKCYVGFDENSQIKFWRLLTTTKKSSRFREKKKRMEKELKVGNFYRFTTIRYHPVETPYPHRTNDVLVSTEFACLGSSTNSLFEDIAPYSLLTVRGVFHPGKIKCSKYIEEEEICPSTGVLKCKGRQLLMYSTLNREGEIQRRLMIKGKADDKLKYNFPITAEQEGLKQTFKDHEDVLVVLGLARPFAGTRAYVKEPFSSKRCYILVIGIIPEDYHENGKNEEEKERKKKKKKNGEEKKKKEEEEKGNEEEKKKKEKKKENEEEEGKKKEKKAKKKKKKEEKENEEEKKNKKEKKKKEKKEKKKEKEKEEVKKEENEAKKSCSSLI